MSIIDNIIQRAKKNKKKIVLPETMDLRVLKAAEKIVKEKIADIILIGDINKIKKIYPNFNKSNIEIINPKNSKLTNDLIDKLFELRKEKGLT